MRREFLASYLTRKTVLKGTATFLATAAAHDADVLASIGGNAYAANILGGDATPYGRNGPWSRWSGRPPRPAPSSSTWP